MSADDKSSCYQGGKRESGKREGSKHEGDRRRVLMVASVASMIDQFNMPNLRLMQQMGYEVHVACNFVKGNTCDDGQILRLKKKLYAMHIVWHQWDCPRSLRLAACIWAYCQLWRLTGKYRFLWMHCQSPVGGALARIVAHWRGIRVLYTVHGFHFYKGAPWKNWALYYSAEKLLAHWTDMLITVNEEDDRIARQKFAAGCVCRIPGVGVDTDRYAPGDKEHAAEKNLLRERFHIPGGAYVILSVGELNKGKNHRLVIKALADLGRTDVCYLICGQGRWKKKLQRYAQKLGVRRLVRMAGYQKDLRFIYKNADLFVFPSIREGMPVALMEAMAAGMPCLVSDIRGNRELITDAALRFSPDRADELRDALGRMIGSSARMEACGKQNLEKISGFSQKAVQERMRCIYEKMALKNDLGANIETWERENVQKNNADA